MPYDPSGSNRRKKKKKKKKKNILYLGTTWR
jgi:hypothetical protein